ncbi:hypothetical protein MD484_g8956, partial [Candolleomyces efflorescens]
MALAQTKATMAQVADCTAYAKYFGDILQRPSVFEFLTLFIAIAAFGLSEEPLRELNHMNVEHQTSSRAAQLFQAFQ